MIYQDISTRMAKIIQQKLTTLIAGKNVGMYKRVDTAENSLVVSYEVKLICTTLVGTYAQDMTSQDLSTEAHSS